MPKRITRSQTNLILGGSIVLAMLCCGGYICSWLSGSGDTGSAEPAQQQPSDEESPQQPADDGEASPVGERETGEPPSPDSRLPTARPAPTDWPMCDCGGDLFNCADFDTAGEAQACYEHCLVETGADVHLLDWDENGVVCETVWGDWATPIVTNTPIATNTPVVVVQPTHAGGSGGSVGCYSRTCGTFSSCGAVYAYLEQCPQYWRARDGDGDGIPCESLCR